MNRIQSNDKKLKDLDFTKLKVDKNVLINIIDTLLNTNNNTITTIKLVYTYIYPNIFCNKLLELLDNNINLTNVTIPGNLDDLMKNKIRDKVIINVSIINLKII